MRRRFYVGGGLMAAVCSALVFAHVHSRAEAQQLTFGPARPSAGTLADPDIVFSENPEQAAADKAIFDELAVEEPLVPESAEEPFADEPLPLTNRTKYLELLRRKAELMTDEQIDAELQEVTADIGELEASRKFEQIMTELQALVGKHPNSVAAKKARRMVETAAMPTHELDEATGAFRRVIEPDAPSYYGAPSSKPTDNGSDAQPSSRPLDARPTPADGDFRPQ